MTQLEACPDETELTIEQTHTLLEQEVRKYLDMSLDDFYRCAEEGHLPDHPVVPHLVLMSGARATSC